MSIRATLRRVAVTASVAAVVVGLGACGDDDQPTAEATTTTVSPCTAAAPGGELPQEFPDDLPLPDTFVVTASEQRSGGRTVLDGVTTDGFAPTLRFLQQELPKAGYELAEGEVEENDAESNFAGHDVKGRWAIRVVDGCADRTTLSIVVQPTS